MFCSKCGSSIKEGASFCDQCGNPVASAAKSTGNTLFPQMTPGSQMMSGNTQTFQQYAGGQPVINQPPQAAENNNAVKNNTPKHNIVGTVLGLYISFIKGFVKGFVKYFIQYFILLIILLIIFKVLM